MSKTWVLAGLWVCLFSNSKILGADKSESDPTVFQGGYLLSEKGCGELVEGGFERAYIKVGKDAVGAKEISISLYGEDARVESILLDKGSRKPLGVAAGQPVVESWEATFETPVRLVSKKTTKAPKFEFSEVQELEIPKGKVNVRYSSTEGDKKVVCELVPNLSKKQKTAVCNHILIAKPELKKELPVEECLDEGTFTADSNDAGQLGLTYSNVALREGNIFTCEVSFDKPLGKFAPKVESCEFN